LSAAEQAARVCAYLMPERMLALLEAELEKAVELESRRDVDRAAGRAPLARMTP
jgi:hypothetical protein